MKTVVKMFRLAKKPWFSVFILCFFILSCGSGDDEEMDQASNDVCDDYPEWESSAYVLPFPVGFSSRISQGNCTAFSHQGTLRYSYDFEMPFGSVVVAAREGVVFGVRDGQPAGTRGLEASNWIQIRHSDGFISEYVHLMTNSSKVKVGDFVRAGDTIALTGDTGDVGTWPHLHFDINRCGNNLACDTEPVTFRNTSGHPNGLVLDSLYLAGPY